MFAGLFGKSSPVSKAKPILPARKAKAQPVPGAAAQPGKKQALNADGKRGKTKPAKQSQTDKESKIQSSSAKHKTAAPAGAIPMTEDEISGFQKWLREQKGQPSTGVKRKQVAIAESPAPEVAHDAPLSKKAKKRLRQQEQLKAQEAAPQSPGGAFSAASVLPKLAGAKGQGAIGKAAARLQGSRFRMLNEKLYHITGEEAKKLYDKDPSLAKAYHEGFREQASKWPRNPLDDVIKWLKDEVPSDKVIGDFGCGDARLALELKGRTVHSFDLVEINERVTACNLAEVPLADQTLDVAVFCLALMGTDWPSFLEEAYRCLRPGGLLHIAEVESRMSDVKAMTKTVEAIGFSKLFVKPDKFFLEMRFRKNAASGGKKKVLGKKRHKRADTGAILSGCIYKRR